MKLCELSPVEQLDRGRILPSWPGRRQRAALGAGTGEAVAKRRALLAAAAVACLLHAAGPRRREHIDENATPK